MYTSVLWLQVIIRTYSYLHIVRQYLIANYLSHSFHNTCMSNIIIINLKINTERLRLENNYIALSKEICVLEA